MPDIIHLLPDSVANQIAAGEVIQRPASVVKELVENAIDAGASKVVINIKDAGKTLIQIVDNGCGMSETDARLAFERHATSKIRNANDLFAIRSLGFRGEALASIAAIAYVELKTKLIDSETGTYLNIVGSEVKEQKSISCPNGSNFLIKNLFFNVPARRKFLKSNSTELHHIIGEFQRIALAYHNVKLILIHNDVEIYHLPNSNLKQRIVNLVGKSSLQNLISVNTSTTLVKINGYIGKPENARKSTGEQFFFVNSRYMRNPYMYKAVMMAYEKILQKGSYPSFFLYFDLDPNSIDINIHPTKTEIKFAEEKTIWQILHAVVKESLGKFSIVPSIDFNQENPIEIPSSEYDQPPKQPEIKTDPSYNPFNSNNLEKYSKGTFQGSKIPENWEALYAEDNIEQTKLFDENINQNKTESDVSETNNRFFQFKKKYIITTVKSGLMIINQKRAHIRILYEKFFFSLKTKQKLSQATLFQQSLVFSHSDFELLIKLMPELNTLGFKMDIKENNTIKIKGIPEDIINDNIKEALDVILEKYKNSELNSESEVKEKIAMSLAVASSIGEGHILDNITMSNLVDLLFACKAPNYTPDGKKIITIFKTEDIEKLF